MKVLLTVPLAVAVTAIHLPPSLQNPSTPSLLPAIFNHPLGAKLQCGGPNHQGCLGKLDCRLPVGECHKDSAAIGLCVPTPFVCLFPGPTVCGCDGVTYESSCEAYKNGTNIAAFATCGGAPDAPAPEPIHAPIPYFQPSNDLPVAVARDHCGIGMPCPSHQYCNYEFCGSSDALGTCLNIPRECPPIMDPSPVCGCDNFTYSSSCEAARLSVTIRSGGPCPFMEVPSPSAFPPPRSIPEPVLPPDACSPWDRQCENPRATCVNVGKDTCDDFLKEMRCIVVEESMCSDVIPVCGCDRQFYSSRCTAWSYSVDVLNEGTCPPSLTATLTPTPTDTPIVTDILGGEPPAPAPCDTFEDCPMEADFYRQACNKRPGHCDEVGYCGARDAIEREFPDRANETVCGCDGVTYTSLSHMLTQTNVAWWGPCEAPPPGPACQSDLDCDVGYFCNLDFTDCGLQGDNGHCQVTPTNCSDEPTSLICGCDGIMYDNACEAARARVSVTTYDACSAVPPEFDLATD